MTDVFYMRSPDAAWYSQSPVESSDQHQDYTGKQHLTPQYAYFNHDDPRSAMPSLSQYTPPLTPQTHHYPNLSGQSSDHFHNYLRAFYHFHPASTISSDTEESSITVPINQGDVILVHSIQPNGWADGTLLSSGARGWLPTNYCDAYDHDLIRNLLDALTYVWEYIRSHEEDEDLSVFMKQDYVRAMIAGVRLLLERSECLTRDSELIKSHVGLRRLRKSILGDLAAFVKAAKLLQENCRSEIMTPPDMILDQLDHIILKAFKVVTRAVKFLDVWKQDVALQPEVQPICPDRTPPLTPASESPPSQQSSANLHSNANGFIENCDVSPVVVPTLLVEPRAPDAEHQSEIRDTSFTTIPTNELTADLRPSSLAQKRLSACHRLSYNSKSSLSQKDSLASERLSAAHDTFLSSLAAFIGLHLQSRSSIDLLVTTQQSVATCQALLAIVEEVWERDSRRSVSLDQARDTMQEKLAGLVQATRDIFRASSDSNESEIYIPDDGRPLVDAATLCVRSAGTCVSRTKAVIERIGDFTLDLKPTGLGISETFVGDPVASSELVLNNTKTNETVASKSILDSFPVPLSPTSLLPPLEFLDSTRSPDETTATVSSASSRKSMETVVCRSSSQASVGSRKFPSLELEIPPSSPIVFPEPSTLEANQTSPSHADSAGASLAETASTCSPTYRLSKNSLPSTTSTCATSPNQSPVKEHPLRSANESFDSLIEPSSSTATEDQDATEAELLTTTYVHQLMFNKDGQISGGSLPALVEQLTTHHSTPDAAFVNTFYLTFRLFTTPLEFAQTLIDRFEYICQSPVSANPVRLRVYNVFKGWLETHWQSDPDVTAVDKILDFANGQLKVCLPSAGKRLVELVSKVSTSPDQPIVPRLVSTLGKTNISLTSTVAADAPVPSPVVTKGQLNQLKKALSGAANCSILDFDPLELARQFTLIESKIFCSIQPEELLASEWMKKQETKATNVRAMSTLSTDLANLVADTILQLEEPKKRALVLKQWVKIAKKCRELHNYDSLLAIICSLNSSMVSRLKRTWELLSPKTLARLDELRGIVDCSRNYASLRQLLQNHVAPCIPFVGIYLTDLTFIDVGNQTTRQLKSGQRLNSVSEGMEDGADTVSVINFDKHAKTAKIIGDLQRFQIPYRLAVVPEMQEWMEAQIQRVRSSGEANVQTFYRRSLLLEPREPQVARPSPTMQETPGINTSFSSMTSTSSAGKENSSNSTTKERFESWSARHFPHGLSSNKAKVAL